MADSKLIIDIESNEFTTFVTPLGDIDLSKSTELRSAIRPVIAKKPMKIIIDLHAVSYMDSSGAATLIEAFQLSKQADIQFVLCCLTNGVQSIIELTRLDQIFTICDSREDAVAE